MSTSQQSEIADSKLTVARKLHPEDISVGDDVAVALIAYQYPSFLWCGVDFPMSVDRIVGLSFLPTEFELLRVESLCLPFVFCQTVDRKHKVLDLRQVELMKLNREFAAIVRKGQQRDEKTTKNCKSRGKRKQKAK